MVILMAEAIGIAQQEARGSDEVSAKAKDIAAKAEDLNQRWGPCHKS